jgi:AsmA protein
MLFRRQRWYWLIPAVIVLIPALMWLGVVLVAPTGWAKRQLVASLESRTGRSVRLQSVSVGLLGAIRLNNLVIGSPQRSDDPWFHVEHVQLDINPLHVVAGKLRPTEVQLEGANLRVLRRADLSLELAESMDAASSPSGMYSTRPGDNIAPLGLDGRPRASAPRHGNDDARPLVVHFRHGEVTLIDEPTQTRVRLQNVEGKGVTEGKLTHIHELRGTFNGGTIVLAGRLERSEGAPTLEARLRADNVGLDDGLRVLRHVIPVLASSSLNLRGRLHADVYLRGRVPTWDYLSDTLEGHGAIALDPIDLAGSPLVAELARLGELSHEDRVGSIRSDFVVKDRRVTTDHCTLKVGRVPLALTGWTDFGGRLEYQIKMKNLRERLPEKARRFLGGLDLDIQELTTLNLHGTLDSMVVQVAGMSLDRNLLRDAGLRREDQEKLRAIGRQLRDKLLR